MPLQHCQQDEVEDEEQRDNPDDRVNALGFLLAGLDDAVGDEAGGDAVADRVRERHEHGGEERRNRLGDVAPLDLLEAGGHHAADDDQHAGRRCGRHRGDHRGQEDRQRKADGHDHGGQAGAAARRDARGRLDVGGGVRGAADRADGGGDRVGEQGAIQLGGEALAVLHVLHVVIGEDAGAAAGADERAERVERVGHREREDRDQHERQFGYVGEQRREAIGAEDHAEGLRQLGERVGDGHGVGHAGQAHRDADDRGDDDGQQHAALELEHGEHDGEQQADQEQPQGRGVQRGQTRRGAGGQALAGGLGVLRGEGDEVDVEHADVGDEDADAAADGVLQHGRDRLDDHLADLGDGDDDVDEAAQEHHAQRLLPRELQTEAHRVGEERVEAHAGRLRVRHIGEQAHDERADDGRDDRCQEHAAPRHAGLVQDLRIDDDDVAHREERGEAGHDLRGHGRAVLLQMEELLHTFSASLNVRGHPASARQTAIRPVSRTRPP